MANENKLTTKGQMKSFAEMQDARDDAQDQKIENHGHTADSVTFNDGETLQQKCDSGELMCTAITTEQIDAILNS